MDPEEDTSRLLQLRSAEPDVFHYTVKMHLSFLLDLTTDDCDCSFVYSSSSSASSSTKDTPGANLRRLIFTPRKGASSSSSSSSAGAGHPHYKGVMDGAPLTQEGVCQVSQLVQFVGRPHNLTVEGIFRKSGNLKKVQVLKEMLNKGVPVDLDSGDFSVHECAAVLKKFLDGLAEPLLTDACYRAHCQVAQLDCSKTATAATADGPSSTREKKIECLQLLFLLIPEVNVNLLKDLLSLLLKVSQHEKSNKMSASNLGTMFAPSILCPRKLSPESLQSNHAMLTRAVAFMIEESEHLFRLPERLRTDLEINLRRATTPVRPRTRFQGASPVASASCSSGPQSPVVNTIFSFVDRQQTNRLAAMSSTEQALAELYAQVQAMPESAQKKKFVAKLNDANGQGKPGTRNNPRQQRKKKNGGGEGTGGGGGFMGLLTPKKSVGKNNSQQHHQKLEESKIGHRHASYSFKTPSKPPSQVLHSFKPNPNSEEKMVNQKLLSPQSSPAIMVSPGTLDSIVQRSAGGRRQQQQQQENLDGSYTESDSRKKKKELKQPPPTPQRVSSLVTQEEKATTSDTSPISNCAKKMSSEMQKSMMTPRSRKPVLAQASTVTLESNNPPPLSTFVIPDESPCQPPKYNEDEPDVVDGEILKGEEENQEPEVLEEVAVEENGDSSQTSSCFSAERFFATSNEDDSLSTEREEYMFTPGISSERDISEITVRPVTYSSRSLKKGFTEYLGAHEMEAPGEASMLEASISSSVIGTEAQMLLNNELCLSDSMRAVLNGDDPDEDVVAQEVMPSMLVPVDVDSPCSPSSDEEEEDKENNVKASSDDSEARSSGCRDIPLPINCGSAKKVSTSSIQVGGSAGNSGKRKRRSLTEVSDLNPISRRRAPQKRNIIFQTDL